MTDSEGSVTVDGVSAAEASAQEAQEAEDASQSGEEQQTQESQAQEEQQDETAQQDGKVTDKGTKLADDPLQQANQLRANAERKLKDYESYFSDPKNVEAYLGELRRERGVEEKPQAPESQTTTSIDPDKIETVEDLRTFAKQLKADADKQITELKQGYEGFTQTQREQAVAQRISSQIDAVRGRYDVLRPTNPDGSANPAFDSELEERLGKAFERLDLDPKTGKFRGQVDFEQFAEDFMFAAKRGENQGTQKAQTVVKDRRAGRVISGTTTTSEPDEKDLSASQMIASRIQRAAQRRN